MAAASGGAAPGRLVIRKRLNDFLRDPSGRAEFSSATARCPPHISPRVRSATTSAVNMSHPVPQSASGLTMAGDLILVNDSNAIRKSSSILNAEGWHGHGH
jgi:hypothetical protein